MFYFVFVFFVVFFCCCCFYEYVTMNFAERPGINTFKTILTMSVKEHRKYHF